MTLIDLCEPLFQYVCCLNRAGRKSGNFPYPVVRAEIKAIFEDLRSKSASDARLNLLYKSVELPFVFFIDSMVAESALAIAREWNLHRMANDYNELAGDEKFFDLLEETMRDQGDDATEKLTIYYMCLGLGFTGWYAGQPEYLREKMLQLAPRIRNRLESDQTVKICPENYENIDTRDLIQPPSRYMVVIGIIFLVFSFTTLACNYYLFKQASVDLTKALSEIIAHDKELGQ